MCTPCLPPIGICARVLLLFAWSWAWARSSLSAAEEAAETTCTTELDTSSADVVPRALALNDDLAADREIARCARHVLHDLCAVAEGDGNCLSLVVVDGDGITLYLLDSAESASRCSPGTSASLAAETARAPVGSSPSLGTIAGEAVGVDTSAREETVLGVLVALRLCFADVHASPEGATCNRQHRNDHDGNDNSSFHSSISFR